MIEWSQVPERLQQIDAQSSEPIDQETLRNSAHFIVEATNRVRAPDAVERGDFPTLCFFWEIDEMNSIEVEVFSTSFELYEEQNGVMIVKEFSAEGSDNIFPEFSEMIAYITKKLKV